MDVHSRIGARRGPAPKTGPAIPHQQLSQNAPVGLQEQLWQRMLALPGVRSGPSGISAPDTRALHLEPGVATGPGAAFLIGTEFAHIHGPADGSLHLTLPPDEVNELQRFGWGELHPIARDGLRPATLVMVFGPRDADELGVVWQFVQRSFAYATGAREPALTELGSID
jgi:phospholipase/carboxylesterase